MKRKFPQKRLNCLYNLLFLFLVFLRRKHIAHYDFKKGKEKYFAYNKLIDIYKYTDQQIKDLMKEMRME